MDLLEEEQMSNSLITEPDDGLDYVFARMGAVYGSAFNRQWEGMDVDLVRQEWKHQLGSFLTYKPSLDYAFTRLDPDFPPSAVKFRTFCNGGPDLPVKNQLLEMQTKPPVPMPDYVRKQLEQLKRKMRMDN